MAHYKNGSAYGFDNDLDGGGALNNEGFFTRQKAC